MFEALIRAITSIWLGLVRLFFLRPRAHVQPRRAAPVQAVTLDSALDGPTPSPTPPAAGPSEGMQGGGPSNRGSPQQQPGSSAEVEDPHAMDGSGGPDVGYSQEDVMGSPAASPGPHRQPSECICTLRTLAVSWTEIAAQGGYAKCIEAQ